MRLLKSSLGWLMACTATISLTACDQFKRPEYWLCEGATTQKVFGRNNVLLEKYSGSDPIMLEMFGKKIYQFLSPSYSGEYRVCSTSSTPKFLSFQSGECDGSLGDGQSTSLDSKIPLRKASLDLETGQFIIGESRSFGDKKIISEGTFTCRKLGNTFSFNDFNHAKD
jgi:hypothetical protein